MLNQIKKLTILLFYISVSYSFLKSNIPYKIIRRDISSFNSNIYDDISCDVFNKKNFFKNEISCYAINFSPDNLKLCKNCKNFIPNDIFKFKYNNITITTDIPSKIIENININSGFCNKFSIINRINGDEQKILAFVCRANEQFCGNHAKYYEE